jgi:Exocyst complex component Sec6
MLEDHISHITFPSSCLSYRADHTKTQTAEGRLVTSLCEDVYSLAGVQLRTIRERLTRRSEALVQAVGVVFKNLYEKQMTSRDEFCTDLETCCAASNDFIRMSEKCEEIVTEIQDECNLAPEASETLEEQSAALLGLYSGDAVYAAQKTHVYCFEPIEEAIASDLFSAEWQDNLTHNELALTVVRTLDDFMEDLETFLDEVMVIKVVEAQITSSVIFYIRMLLLKSSQHKGRDSYFSNNELALNRMRGDIHVLRDYFQGLSENMPTLTRVMETEFGLLDAVLELLSIAAGLSKSDAHDFILVLQKRVRNVQITKFAVGDLYHLMKPADERSVYELVDTMEEEMQAVAPNDEKAMAAAQDRMTVPGLRVDQMMAKHIHENTRNRPLKAGNLERAEAALRSWRVTWGGGDAVAAAAQAD